MPLFRGTPSHLPAIDQLLQSAYYRYVDMGMEDLPRLVEHALTVVGVDGVGVDGVGVDSGGGNSMGFRATPLHFGGAEQSQARIWGFLCVQTEDRPPTMPAGAPTRANLRAVAFRHNHRPEIELGRLMEMIVREQTETYSVQYLCYGGEHWLSSALKDSGFEQVEAVQFYQLDRLRARLQSLPAYPSELTFAPLSPALLDEVATLDAATFEPLWHFGRRDLFELLMRGRMHGAWWNGKLAGYSAVCANTHSEAQLARLAVHPDFQGRGIGRALVSDSIRYAAESFSVLVLNTQVNNSRSQSLYRSMGFRPMGSTLPVMGLTIN